MGSLEASSGQFTVLHLGNGVHRAVAVVLNPKDSPSLLGFAFQTPTGAGDAVAMVDITRFDSSGNFVSGIAPHVPPCLFIGPGISSHGPGRRV